VPPFSVSSRANHCTTVKKKACEPSEKEGPGLIKLAKENVDAAPEINFVATKAAVINTDF
jgi:hypothetical protein